MRQRLLLIAIVALSGLCFAQGDTSSDRGPSPSGDADHAGRPVSNVQVPSAAPLPPTEQQQFEQNVKDIHFDFDRSDLRMDERTTLAEDAQWLKTHTDVLITIEGDADERGDIVYNLALSDQRAIATRDALVDLGVPRDRIVFAAGWGKLYPVCAESDESCWNRNRRGHFALWQPLPEATQVASR
jgi:outer membrane protein OmpA-like peptidoglycan-associated protein